MVSIPRPSLGRLGGSPVGSPPPEASSPVSPKSWEDSLLELDSDLQKICGPTRSPLPSPGAYNTRYNSMPSGVNLSQSYPAAAAALLSPPVERSASPLAFCRRAVSQESTLPAAMPTASLERSPSPADRIRPEYMRSQSYATVPSGATSARPLIVRHEQSSEKLSRKLSQICGSAGNLGALPDMGPFTPIKVEVPKDVMTLTSSTVRRESLTSAYRLEVFITGLSVVDLAVCVDASNTLRVIHVSSSEKHVMAESVLPPGIIIHRIMCYIVQDKLVIRERSKSLWSCDFKGLGPQYLPIIQQNELTHELTVVLRIPDELRYEDLSVRTVDDHLIISRKRASFPGSRTRQFEVGLVLPDMGVSRGIDASLTHNNQLFIVVTFDSRRYTS